MLCSFKGRANQAINGGVCLTHGAKRKSCRAMMGCTNQVVKCGVCITHGAKVNNHNGCASYAYKKGVCITHGAKAERKLCSHNGCTN